MKRRRQHTARVRRGVTLAELVVSLVVTGILAGAIISTVLLAGQAIPDASSPTVARMSAGQVVEDIVAELQTATSITQMTQTVIEFEVPDRNGDGSVETIRYTWTASNQGRLERRYNGGASATVIENVREFAVTFQTKLSPRDDEITAVAVLLNTGTGTDSRVRSRALTLNQPTGGT